MKKVPGITPAVVEAATMESRWIYTRAYRIAWWSMIPFVVIAIASLLFMRNVPELMTEKVEATVERIKKKEEEGGEKQ